MSTTLQRNTEVIEDVCPKCGGGLHQDCEMSRYVKDAVGRTIGSEPSGRRLHCASCRSSFTVGPATGKA